LIVDLHMHSTASDGVLAPAALMRCAADAGIGMLALTDHDSLDGLDESRAAAIAAGMHWISGVELSVQWQGVSLHVLGYAFDTGSTVLREALAGVQQGRWQRAQQIDERLAAKRMPGALEGACAMQVAAGGDARQPPGRPHFADWMVEAGYVRDRAEAFRKWLGAGKLGDIRQHWPTLEQGVAWLRESGGIAVLAHPCQYNLTRSRLRRLLRDLVAAGGQGVEVVNGNQPPEQVAYLGKLCVEFGLLASCGSDFHQPGSPWAALGRMTTMPADCQPIWRRWIGQSVAISA